MPNENNGAPDSRTAAPVGSTNGSARPSMMDRRAAAIYRIFRALDTGGDPDRDDVELAMDEIIALRKVRESQAATIRRMEEQAEATYDSDDIPLGAKLAVAELRAIYAKPLPNK